VKSLFMVVVPQSVSLLTAFLNVLP
jgi:hypothetical protein